VGHEYPGIKVNPQPPKSPNRDLLSEIIELVNTRYGITLTDDDRVNLESVRQKIFDDEEIKKYMNGANSQQNKEDFMKKQFDNVMLEFLNSRFDFFKKINDNDSLKKLIFEKIYSDYVRNQTELRN
jgi:type I restriction enzyme R subunit